MTVIGASDVNRVAADPENDTTAITKTQRRRIVAQLKHPQPQRNYT